MDKAPDYYDWIPDYLKGKLPHEQRTKLEMAMTTDATLAKEVADQRQLYMATRLYGPGGIASQLTAMAQSPPRRSLQWPRYAIAAAFILLGIVGGTWWLSKPSGAQEVLAITPPETLSAEIDLVLGGRGLGPSDSLIFLLREALQAYNRGDFPASIPGLETYHTHFPNHEEVGLLLAVSLLQSGEHIRAGEILAGFAQRPTARELSKLLYAAWLWENGRRQEAQPYRNQLQESPDPQVRTLARQKW